jgi:hypothetical protein
MTLALTVELCLPRTDEVLSLKGLWRRSGGKWTKLKKMLIEERGARCEICECESDSLQAHEAWEYVDAVDAGLSPERAQNVLSAWHAKLERVDEIARSLLLRRGTSQSFRPIVRPDRPMVRYLVDIRLLCKPCHDCTHGQIRKYAKHWCRVNGVSLKDLSEYRLEKRNNWRKKFCKDMITIVSEYCDYDKLPSYKTFKEWQHAKQEETDAWHEDDWVYAESEMDDSGFSRSGWISK